MKRNMMSVIILALVLANLVLTGLLTFTILPETKKANAMIEKVCSAIDLELNSGAASGPSSIPIDQIETYAINGGETMTINLRSDDSKNHVAVISLSLSLNTKSDNYVKYAPAVLATKEDIIKNNINQIVSQYSKEEFDANPQAVQDAILEDMQNMFGLDYVVGVNFSSRLTQ